MQFDVEENTKVVVEHNEDDLPYDHPASTASSVYKQVKEDEENCLRSSVRQSSGLLSR